MKNLRILTLLLFISLKSFAQNEGITYQAVIIGPYALELPGVNSENNIFPNETVAIRFSIFDQNDAEIFQEIQITETDDFGRVNLLIGAVNHDAFTKISWDGNNKDLRVEIDFEGGSNFVNMSRDGLTFLPYAYHRNITATGTLKVDDDTFLNGELTVELPTNLNSTLAVNNKNATTLSGDLTTDGVTNLNNSLDVNNKSTTNLSGALNVGVVTGNVDVNAATILNGTLDVVGLASIANFKVTGEAAFNEINANTLDVLESSSLKGVTSIEGTNTITGTNMITGTNTLTGKNNIGTMSDVTDVKGRLTIRSNEQIKIKSTLSGMDTNINSHPVLIEGGSQGLAIKVNGSRNNSTNFITFFDSVGNKSWGRIEGEKDSEFTNNADYNFDIRSLEYDFYDAELDLGWALVDVGILVTKVIAFATDFRACVGFGVCAVSPGPVLIAQVIAEAVVVGLQVGFATDAKNKANSNKDLYKTNAMNLQGVTYASGAGDYAEYLLRADVNESMSYGDIVGVKGGAISKNVLDAERMMVVSYKPIVLGNMPQPNQEKDYEKVAFMGQVPVKVFGKVNIGDYIVPSGNNDGVGKAIASEKISIKDIKNIIGIAWEAAEQENGFKFINVAVGINNNDNNRILEKLKERVLKQDKELNQLKNIMEETINRLVALENKPDTDNLNNTISHNDEDGHTGVSADGRKYVKENDVIYYEITDADIERGFSYAEKMMQESGFDTAIYSAWKKLKDDSSFKLNLSKSLKEKFEKQVHYHKEITKKARN